MMKYIKTILTISIVLSAFVCRADFDDIGCGARSQGMGGAFTGLADDIFSMYYNPAGSAFVSRKQFGAEYGRLYMGLDDDSNLSKSFFGYMYPIHIPKDKKRAWKRKSALPGESQLYNYGTIAVGLSQFNLINYYEERTIWINYAYTLFPGFSIGLNMKNLSEKYELDDYMKLDPVFDYGNRDSLQTFSCDIGTMYRMHSMLYLGCAIKDVNQPDVGLDSVNRLNRQYRFGVCGRLRRFNVLMDYVRKKEDTVIHNGLEYFIFRKIIGLRAGYSQGSRDMRSYSLGMSLNIFDVEIDYAFSYPLAGIKDISGSQQLTLVYRFGYQALSDADDPLSEAFLKMQKEKEIMEEKYDVMEEMKNKIEKQYIEDTTKQQQEIDILKIKEEKLLQELRDRPVKVITKEPPKRPPPPPEYVVQEGDTLRSIAEKLYGNPLRWMDLYNANQKSIKRSVVEPGQILKVPK